MDKRIIVYDDRIGVESSEVFDNLRLANIYISTRYSKERRHFHILMRDKMDDVKITKVKYAVLIYSIRDILDFSRETIPEQDRIIESRIEVCDITQRPMSEKDQRYLYADVVNDVHQFVYIKTIDTGLSVDFSGSDEKVIQSMIEDCKQYKEAILEVRVKGASISTIKETFNKYNVEDKLK